MNAERRRFLPPLVIAIPLVLWVLSELTYDAVATARERAKREVCRSCLNNCINYACHLFAQDHGGHFPPTLGHLYPRYVSDGELLLCPSAGRASVLQGDPHFSHDDYTPAMFGDTHTDYVWVSGLSADDPPHYILAFDDEWNHDGDGVHVLCAGLYAPRDRRNWWPDIKALHDQLARQEKELAAQGRKMTLLRPAWSSWPDAPAGARPWYLTLPWAVRAAATLVLTALVSVTIFRARGRPHPRPLAHRQKGDDARARRDYLKAIELDPDGETGRTAREELESLDRRRDEEQ